MNKTFFLLGLFFEGRVIVPLPEVLQLFGIEDDVVTMQRKAKNHEYPFPCRRFSGQRSQYMVNITDIYEAIKDDKDLRANFEAMKAG